MVTQISISKSWDEMQETLVQFFVQPHVLGLTLTHLSPWLMQDQQFFQHISLLPLPVPRAAPLAMLQEGTSSKFSLNIFLALIFLMQ